MAKFIDPMTDTGFKIVFGKEDQSNEILMALLNELFRGQEGFESIVSLKYINNERSRDNDEGKTIVHDIICETQLGHKFMVEMQKQPQPFFQDRADYYMSRALADQAKKGRKKDEEEWNYHCIPVVGVFFSNFHVDTLEEKLVTHGMICDTDTGKPISRLWRCAFVQLPYFTRESPGECETFFEELIYTIKNLKNMQTIPFTSHKDIFDRLANISNVAALSREERLQYEYDLKRARDYNAEMEYATSKAEAKGLEAGFQKGLARGVAQGIETGRTEEKFLIASKMLENGFDFEKIAQITDIPIEELVRHFNP